jgi:hypothetical protein
VSCVVSRATHRASFLVSLPLPVLMQINLVLLQVRVVGIVFRLIERCHVQRQIRVFAFQFVCAVLEAIVFFASSFGHHTCGVSRIRQSLPSPLPQPRRRRLSNTAAPVPRRSNEVGSGVVAADVN